MGVGHPRKGTTVARAKWLSVDRIAAAVAANQSPQRVSLYGSPTVDVLAGHLNSAKAPRHRRARGADGRQDGETDDSEGPSLEVDAAPV